MRVIAGQAGGNPLKAPASGARPTSDRVREALFSSIASDIAGARVLDLFAGSGTLGIEALSRGAEHCVFIEQNRAACAVIRINLEKTRLAQRAAIRQAECPRCLAALAREGARFDLVFADPPYVHQRGDTDHATALLACPHLPELMAPGALLILETLADAPGATGWPPPPWTLERQRDYGSTRLSLLRAATGDDNPEDPASPTTEGIQ